jgi:hypothetical protein
LPVPIKAKIRKAREQTLMVCIAAWMPALRGREIAGKLIRTCHDTFTSLQVTRR